MEKRTKPASLPSHSGRTLLSIDDDGNYVEIPVQREQSSSVKKTFVDIGRPEIALQKVTCGRGIQWDFVQMITDKAQLHFYIDHFSLSHNIRRDKSGRMHLHCLERNGAFKCPYRMMLIVKEKHALYATGVHNHSLKLTKRKPIKLDLKELDPTAEHQKRHFELHSFTEDVIQLAEEMGLDFRKERGHFVLSLKSFAEGDKENQPSTSSSVQQNEEVVKLLVFVDKRSSIRCREYSRKTTYDNAGSSREEKLLEHDDRLMKGKKEHWQKWGRTQFLRAVRSKCKQFFFGKFDEEETSSS